MEKATNAAGMRNYNRKLILNRIRISPVSRAELASTVQLTRASVTQIMDELLEMGLVEPMIPEESPAQEEVAIPGRPPTRLRLCHRSRFVFGVNISRLECTVGVTDLYGEVLASESVVLAGRSAEDVLEEIATVILRQRDALRLDSQKILGIGVCTPGPVDYRTGTLRNPPNFAAWHGVRVCEALQKRTGLPALLEKDTNARALEMKYFGSAQPISSFILVLINEGVGSGVVIRERLYRGESGLGSEIGHTSVCFDGPRCSCGNRGCLENYLRIPTLLADTPYGSWEELAAHESEPEAEAVLERAADCLAAALTNAINLYDLEKVFLAGAIESLSEPLLRRLNERMSGRVLSRTEAARDLPVQIGTPAIPVRTGAMSMLHSFFQERE